MPFYPSCLAPPAVTLHLCTSVLPSHCDKLLVFIFASQFHASRSYCSLCFLPTLSNRSLALFHRCYSPSSSFSLYMCTRTGRVRGRRLAQLERVLACACLQLASHTLACYLTCDLYCIQLLKEYW